MRETPGAYKHRDKTERKHSKIVCCVPIYWCPSCLTGSCMVPFNGQEKGEGTGLQQVFN